MSHYRCELHGQYLPLCPKCDIVPKMDTEGHVKLGEEDWKRMEALMETVVIRVLQRSAWNDQTEYVVRKESK